MKNKILNLMIFIYGSQSNASSEAVGKGKLKSFPVEKLGWGRVM